MNQLEAIRDLRFPAPLPQHLLHLRHRVDAPRVDDVAAAVVEALEPLLRSVQPGARVAVGVGSRGIRNLPLIVKTVVGLLKAHGAQPYIVPAMGSHGGATAEGQIGVLERLGVTPESMGAPVTASMDVVEIGRIPGGPRIYQGSDAHSADHTLLIARIKPHTDFRGTLESGPAKMAVIGLGKQTGALAMHVGGTASFQAFLAPGAALVAHQSNLLGALCVLENAHEETARVVTLAAGEIGGPLEQALLVEAKALLGRIPFDEVDVLVVREMGKEISGTGFDTNAIGRLRIPGQDDRFGNLFAAAIAVLDLTPGTHGHASGMGLADVTTARLVQKIDWAATYTNAITAGIFGLQRHALPITLANDERALEVAVRCCARPVDAARWLFARNTLAVDELWVSETLRAAVLSNPALEILGETPLVFDAAGVMQSPWAMPD